MVLSDDSGSCQVAAFDRVALDMFSVLEKQPYGLQEVSDKVNRGWSPVFLARYDVRVKLDADYARATVVAARRSPSGVPLICSYLYSAGSVLPTRLRDIHYDDVTGSCVTIHQNHKWILSDDVFIELLLSATERAEMQEGGDGYLRIISQCEEVHPLQDSNDEPAAKKPRDGNTTNKIKISSIVRATEVLDYEIRSGLSYLIIATNLGYDKEKTLFTATVSKSWRIETDLEPFHKNIKAASLVDDATHDATATSLKAILSTPKKLWASMQEMNVSPSGGPWTP